MNKILSKSKKKKSALSNSYDLKGILSKQKISENSSVLSKQMLDGDLLKKYADVIKHKVISSQSDLDPENIPLLEMLNWCKEHGDIVALSDGTILSANPSSRVVQNCKVVMLHKGIRPGRVLAATHAFIQMLLVGANENGEFKNTANEAVSVQQQRLRVLVRDAIGEGVSDIHIEVRADIAKIRFRRHGELYLYAEWLPKLGREIASVAFNKETDYAVTHFNPLIPQSASMPLFIEGQNIRLRLASMPSHGGFDVVMRLLTTGDERIQALGELGYTPSQVSIIKRAVHMPHGAIIIAGPTGSGKTTTLASCINMINTERKIYTIENPVEKLVEKATQVPVTEDQEDRTFASLGRASLRMDPDVIVLGEMRDHDTAAVMTRASITGHLVFSTLHTNTAPGVVPRLVDMGISPSLLSDSNMLVCLICQRLVPTLCKECSVLATRSLEHKANLPKYERIFGEDLKNIRVRGKYCRVCKGLGINGRTVVAELVWIDETSRYFIQKNDTLGWEKYLKESGWQPYFMHALDLVRQGICDPFDAEKLVGDLDLAFAGKRFNYDDAK